MNVLCPSLKNTERYASLRARMSDPANGAKYLRMKAAKHTHAVIRASGRVCGEEARAARKANCAARRAAKQEQASVGKQWRYGQSDLTGI